MWFAFGCADEAFLPEYGLFLADGEYDPLDASVVPPTFDAFFTDRLGWSTDDIDAVRSDAKAHMAKRYGIDVDGLVAEGRMQWLELHIDPRANYRAYALPGYAIGPEGWTIHEITLSAIAIDPKGIELGGPYAGARFGPGPVGAYGYYQVEPDDNDLDPLVIQYQTNGLMGTSFDGRNLLFCEMTSDALGTGLGHVTSEIRQLDNGRLSYDFTNAQRWD